MGCLLLEQDASHEAGAAAQQDLVTVLMETATLWCSMFAYNVSTVYAVLPCRMDNGQPLQTPPGDALYTQFLVCRAHALTGPVASMVAEAMHSMNSLPASSARQCCKNACLHV